MTIAFVPPAIGRGKDKYIPKSADYIQNILPDNIPQACQSHTLAGNITEARKQTMESKRFRYGIDVSRYQGKIDWNTVAGDKHVGYVYLKATEGATLVDVRYHYNLAEAKRAGLRVGCYHFFSPTIEADVQFNNFSRVVRLEEQDLLPIVDVEVVGRRTNIWRFRDRLARFLHLIEKHYGIKPIIYTSRNFYNEYLAGKFTEYKLMIAQYRDEEPQLIDKNAQMVMWQFTSKGRIEGINGPVDRSRFMNDFSLSDILLH